MNLNHAVIDGDRRCRPLLAEKGEHPRVTQRPREVEHLLCFTFFENGQTVQCDSTEERIVIDDGVALGFPFA